jgi:hypothetical protein
MNTITSQKEYQALKEQAVQDGFRGSFNVACFARMTEVNPQAWVEAARQVAAECRKNTREMSYTPSTFAVQRVRFW